MWILNRYNLYAKSTDAHRWYKNGSVSDRENTNQPNEKELSHQITTAFNSGYVSVCQSVLWIMRSIHSRRSKSASLLTPRHMGFCASLDSEKMAIEAWLTGTVTPAQVFRLNRLTWGVTINCYQWRGNSFTIKSSCASSDSSHHLFVRRWANIPSAIDHSANYWAQYQHGLTSTSAGCFTSK